MAKPKRSRAVKTPATAEEVLLLLGEMSREEQRRFEELYLPTSREHRALRSDLEACQAELNDIVSKRGRKPGPSSQDIWNVICHGCALGKSYGKIAQKLNDLKLTKRDGTPHDANSVKSLAHYYNIAGGITFPGDQSHVRKYWP